MATAELERETAFILRPEQVRRLWSLLEEQIGKTTATIHSAHKVRTDYSDLEQLLQYENARGRHIVRLSLKARSEDYKRSASVTFGGIHSIEAAVDAPLPVATSTRDEVADVVGAPPAGTRSQPGPPCP